MEVICLHVTDDVTERPVQKVKVFQGREKIDDVINAERYSCYCKLLRVTAWVRRFIDGLKRRGEVSSPSSSIHQLMSLIMLKHCG